MGPLQKGHIVNETAIPVCSKGNELKQGRRSVPHLSKNMSQTGFETCHRISEDSSEMNAVNVNTKPMYTTAFLWQLRFRSHPGIGQTDWSNRCFSVTGINACHHISVTSNEIFVSNKNKIIVLSSMNKPYVDDLLCSYTGSHTVNSNNELIYINMNYNIMLSSRAREATVIINKKGHSKWLPTCVWSSKLNNDLLVGMHRESTQTGKIARFKQTEQMLRHYYDIRGIVPRHNYISNKYNGYTQSCELNYECMPPAEVDEYFGKARLIQIVEVDCSGLTLYRDPCFITENRNGDIVVSDWRAVVVTTREGKYRFTYSGHASELELEPRGICTTGQLHILVCDSRSLSVHILDKDGNFLSYLLQESGVYIPWSLGYKYDIPTSFVTIGFHKIPHVLVCEYRSQGKFQSVCFVAMLLTCFSF